MFVVAVVLSLGLAVVFVASGLSKLVGAPPAEELRTHLDLSQQRMQVIGALEIAGAIGLLVGIGIAAIGVAAAVGLALLMAGAIGSHRKVGDDPTMFIPSLLLFGLSVLTAIARGVSV